MREMQVHDGVCKYCGNTQPIMAMDQIDANEKISDDCGCGGAELDRKKNALYQNLDFTIGDGAVNAGMQRVSARQEEVITKAALAVLYEVIDKVTFKLDGTTVTITRTSEKVKVKRDDKKSMQLET